MGELLRQLGFEQFESAICCRLGSDSADALRDIRYEDLLEMGLSKVQCHLFQQKVSGLLGPQVASSSSSSFNGASAAAEELEMMGDLDGDHFAGELGERAGSERRQEQWRPRGMPPLPFEPSLILNGFSMQTKRPRGSSGIPTEADHYTSEQLSTVGSASGGSTSSSHQEPRLPKRRRIGAWRGDERRRSSRGNASSCYSLGPAGWASSTGETQLAPPEVLPESQDLSFPSRDPDSIAPLGYGNSSSSTNIRNNMNSSSNFSQSLGPANAASSPQPTSAAVAAIAAARKPMA